MIWYAAVVRVLSGSLHVVIWMWVVMGRAWVVITDRVCGL